LRQLRELAKACGWLEKLEALCATTARKNGTQQPTNEVEKESRDELLEDEVDKLAEDLCSLTRFSNDRVSTKRHEIAPF
jgi:NAD-dependent histone deacetylase SIR2